jgi:hypothetical protein
LAAKSSKAPELGRLIVPSAVLASASTTMMEWVVASAM